MLCGKWDSEAVEHWCEAVSGIAKRVALVRCGKGACEACEKMVKIKVGLSQFGVRQP